MRTELFKEILALPTQTRSETAVINFLVRYAEEWGYAHEVDEAGNVFITKGKPESGIYPLVCAHTDSVHSLKPTIIKEVKGEVWAVDAKTGEPVGCGGDDKCGVFICLELLQACECLKAAFFMGEECFCIGSHAAGDEFFKDVGYCMEFDSPQGRIVSFSSNGMQLFDPHGDFAMIAVPIMDAHNADQWQDHPFTDIAILKRRFDFTCVNLPAGYYKMHSSREYVKLDEVQNSVNMGTAMIKALGCVKYPWDATERRWHDKPDIGRTVTGLVLD